MWWFHPGFRYTPVAAVCASGSPLDAYYTPDGSDYYKTPDGADYYAEP